jgi:glutaredoxin
MLSFADASKPVYDRQQQGRHLFEKLVSVLREHQEPFCAAVSGDPAGNCRVRRFIVYNIVHAADVVIRRGRLDERKDGQDIQDYLLETTGQRTVPSVFISKYHLLFISFQVPTLKIFTDQKHIGGAHSLSSLPNYPR